MKEYVLQFLSQQQEEDGCDKSFKAMFWSLGIAAPCMTHHPLGSKFHLCGKQSNWSNSFPGLENLANSEVASNLSFASGK